MTADEASATRDQNPTESLTHRLALRDLGDLRRQFDGAHGALAADTRLLVTAHARDEVAQLCSQRLRTTDEHPLSPHIEHVLPVGQFIAVEHADAALSVDLQLLRRIV